MIATCGLLESSYCGPTEKAFPERCTGQTAREATEARRRAACLRDKPITFVASEHFATSAMHERWDEASASLLLKIPPATSKKRGVSAYNTPLGRACELPLLEPEHERQLFEFMNYQKFLASELLQALPSRAPLLKDVVQIETCLSLADQARNRIVGANVRLVVSIAKSYANARHALDELVSEGIMTMMHAVDKFDYERGFRFSTYATRAIRRELYRLQMNQQKERRRFVSDEQGVAAVADERRVSFVSEGRWAQLQMQMKRLLQTLDPREVQILSARFGLGKSEKAQTLQSVAQTLGVCKERVRQLEKRALDKLQHLVRASGWEEAFSESV